MNSSKPSKLQQVNEKLEKSREKLRLMDDKIGQMMTRRALEEARMGALLYERSRLHDSESAK
jgi:hypothetical protein